MKKEKIIYSGPPVRFDVFLAGAVEGFSRPYARRVIEGGYASVNGSPRKPGYVLSDGDAVELAPPGAGKEQGGFEDLVLYEDGALLAVRKPAGLAVHPNSPQWESSPKAALIGEPTLVSMLFAARPKTAAAGLERLGLVHRLDRDTSGLMVIAKTPEAQEALSEGFRERLMEKTYIGAVAGVPPKEGVIDEPIGRASGYKKIKVWEYGREAVTEYVLKEKGPDCALLEIRPRTGRTNQIRIHLAHIGHPIVGDKLYGGPPAARMLLHSLSLLFTHPVSGKPVRLEAPLPPDFTAAWKDFKSGHTK